MTNQFGHLEAAIIAVVIGEYKARGWTQEELAARAGLPLITIGRQLRRERPMRMDYLALMARAFGWNATELMSRAIQRQQEVATGEQVAPPSGGDPRSVILGLLANPERDEELQRRLSEAVGRTGVTARQRDRIQETIRRGRREELTNALDALPPSLPPKADQPELKVERTR